MLAAGVLALAVLNGPDLAQDAREAQKSGDYRRAARDYETLLKTEPSPELRSNLGVMLYLAGRDREALTQFKLALGEKPSLIASDLFAGLSLLRLGRPREALPFLNKAAIGDPKAAEPQLALGQASLANRQLKLAQDCYRRATELEPGNAEAWYGLGITSRGLAERGLKQASAAGVRGEAIEQSPQGLDAKKELAEAQHAMSRAVEIDPDNVKAHMMLAESFRSAGQKDKSVAEYDAILHSHPNFTPALIGKANTYWKFAEVDEAMETIEKVRRLAPDDPEANGILADLLVTRKRYAEAKPLASKALAQRPDFSFVRVALAKIDMEAGNDREAVQELQKAVPDDLDGAWYYLLGRAFRKLGREPEAQMAFAESRKLRSDSIQ